MMNTNPKLIDAGYCYIVKESFFKNGVNIDCVNRVKPAHDRNCCIENVTSI